MLGTLGQSLPMGGALNMGRAHPTTPEAHGGACRSQAASPWETRAILTLGDIRLRAWASTSWAVATFSVVGG